MQNRDDIPEPVTNNPNYPPPPRSEGGSANRFMQVIIPLVITVVVLFIGFNMWMKPQLVTKTDFNKNIGSVAKDIADIKTKIGTASVNTTALDALAVQVSSVKTGSSDLDKKVTTLDTSVKSLSTQVAGLNGLKDYATKADVTKAATDAVTSAVSTQTSSIKTDVTKISGDVSKLTGDVSKATTEIAKINANIDTAMVSIIDLEDSLAKLQTQVNALKPTPTPTSTPTATPTTTPTPTGTVEALIVPNAFSDNTYMGIPPVASNATVTSTFTLRVANSTGKPIKDLQLAVALGIYDVTDPNLPVPYALPSGVTVTLSSGGNLAIMWKAQSTGDARILGYVNQVNTGTFAFGNWGQGAGVVDYAQSLNFKTDGDTYLPRLLVIPTVKVIGYK